MYRQMMTIRQFEETFYLLFLQGKVPSTLHQYQGEEAVAVGVCANLRRDDVISSTHRPHGHAIAKGVSLNSISAELFGKETGCCRGKGGSMHVGDMDCGMLPANAIVAAGIPISAGAALAFKFQRSSNVAVCFFGDGASNHGAFHEGVNLAAVWKLPVVFVCENNLYAASTRVSKVMRVDRISDRSSAYGLPGVTIDGNDVLEVYRTAGEAVLRARGGEGPTLVECLTYRQRGHSRGDPGHYRPKAEVEEWLGKDPIETLKRHLLEAGILSEDRDRELRAEVAEEVDKAVAFGQASPLPPPEEALAGVYA